MQINFNHPFWELVRVKEVDDCWEKPTNVDKSSGYARYRPHWKGKSYVASRFAAWLAGLVDSPDAPKDRKGTGFVLHKCDNRICCNPYHFIIGTYGQNLADCWNKERREIGDKDEQGKFFDLGRRHREYLLK